MEIPIGRTLVFSFDGTGNEPCDAGKFEHDESISNVLKLHILMGGGLRGDLTETRTPIGAPQQTWYYNGIGTRENGEDIPLVGWMVTTMAELVNSALAPKWGDARRILNEAKADLMEAEPQPEDRIVVFGFSRGAALARKFASLILQEREGLQVAFLGVFDTVAAMDGIHRKGEKIVSDVMFESGTVDRRVKRAVHILSLDEDRVAFEPTQINRDAGDPERITEIWFPGAHSDVGGGYWSDGLSDVALQYMIEQCKATLGGNILFADPRSPGEVRNLLKGQGDVLGFLDADDILMHPNVTCVSRTSPEGLGKLYDRAVRNVCVRENNEALPAATHPPLLHHSVKARFDLVPDYRPASLRGLNFDLLLPGPGTKKETKKKLIGITGLRADLDQRPRNGKIEG